MGHCFVELHLVWSTCLCWVAINSLLHNLEERKKHARFNKVKESVGKRERNREIERRREKASKRKLEVYQVHSNLVMAVEFSLIRGSVQYLITIFTSSL